MTERFTRALQFLATEVAPYATAIDTDSAAVQRVITKMGEAGLMALTAVAPFAEWSIEEDEFRTFQEESARASGTFAFLQTQHQSAVRLIGKGGNETLAAEYVPKMATGEKLLGIGFSQLRRPGKPLLTVNMEADGARLNGHVPWATGFSYYHEILVGATLPNGESLFLVTPFKNAPGISISEPMKLAAMEKACTVTLDYDNYLVPKASIAFQKPAGWISMSDEINIALQGQFAIGCAMAGLDTMKAASGKKDSETLRAVIGELEFELIECRQALRQAIP